MGAAYLSQGKLDKAEGEFRRAIEIDRDDPTFHMNLDRVLVRQGRLPEALAEQRELIRLCPNNITLLNDTAWLLATSPRASFRNGAEAVKFAGRAAQLSKGQDPAILDTLAAALAETDRFADAAQVAHKALDLAVQQNKEALAKSIKAKIPLYEGGDSLSGSAVRTPRNFCSTLMHGCC